MRLHAVEGDIVDAAPEVAEAAVLWLRSGFNLRHVTWFHKLAERYPRLLEGINTPNPPWRSQKDVLLPLSPADGHLRYLYITANPEDRLGCRTIAEVRDCIHRSLDKLSQLGVKRVAMIHIPFAPGEQLAQPHDVESANAMIEALRSWDQENPDRIDDVYLVDLKNAFAPLLD